MSTISFLVPLPPEALRSNNRSPWPVRAKAKQAYSEEVWYASGLPCPECGAASLERAPDMPWARARVVYEWRYCGTAPDLANLGSNTKALQDILCMAPDNGLQPNNTTYLGLVEDDRGIEPVYRLQRVKHRGEQCVYVTVERLP